MKNAIRLVLIVIGFIVGISSVFAEQESCQHVGRINIVTALENLLPHNADRPIVKNEDVSVSRQSAEEIKKKNKGLEVLKKMRLAENR